MIIIDHFTPDEAVCESDGEIINIKLKLIPSDAGEGSVLKFDGENYLLDKKTETIRQEKIDALMSSLFKDSN